MLPSIYALNDELCCHLDQTLRATYEGDLVRRPALFQGFRAQYRTALFLEYSPTETSR